MTEDGNPAGIESAGSATRRRLLRASAVAGIALVSGCIEEMGQEFPRNRKWPTAELTPELPVEERTDVLEAGIEETADADVSDEDEFDAAVGEYAFEVESVERERDVLTLEIVSTNHYENGTVDHLGPIAGAYAALVDAGYDAVALEVTVLDDAPESYGAAEIETAWAEAYNADELSAKEYGELAAATIETARQPPEVDVEPAE